MGVRPAELLTQLRNREQMNCMELPMGSSGMKDWTPKIILTIRQLPFPDFIGINSVPQPEDRSVKTKLSSLPTMKGFDSLKDSLLAIQCRRWRLGPGISALFLSTVARRLRSR